MILRASRLKASSQAAYFVCGLTIDSIAQISLVVLRADSGTASIPRGVLTLAAFSFTTLSITIDFSSYRSKLSKVPYTGEFRYSQYSPQLSPTELGLMTYIVEKGLSNELGSLVDHPAF
ncbi:hypothetical protein RYX36_033673 [Vicia faba]